jgi:hypothetical protein
MTETEWLACEEPRAMLPFLGPGASERRLRLFAVACCRRVQHLLLPGPCQAAVSLAEGQALESERRSVWEDCETFYRSLNQADAASGALFERPRRTADNDAAKAAYWVVANQAGEAAHSAERYARSAAASVACRSALAAGQVFGTEDWDAVARAEAASQAALLRDVFGNPFRPVAVDRSWLTPTVVSLAQAVYDERQLPSGILDNARLAVLSDALTDAGCAEPNLLGHLRSGDEHVRGCFAVDAILGHT